MLISSQTVYKHGRHRQFFFFFCQFLKIFSEIDYGRFSITISLFVPVFMVIYICGQLDQRPKKSPLITIHYPKYLQLMNTGQIVTMLTFHYFLCPGCYVCMSDLHLVSIQFKAPFNNSLKFIHKFSDHNRHAVWFWN